MKQVFCQILWARHPGEVEIEIVHGRLARLRAGAKHSSRQHIRLPARGEMRLMVAVAGANLEPGAYPTRVLVRTALHSFAFLLRDINAANPIFIGPYEVAVTTRDDRRSYHDIVADIASRNLASDLEKIATEPEETFAHAAAATRQQTCENWLGISRDVRLFRVRTDAAWSFVITPAYHGLEARVPARDQALRYTVVAGRGCSVVDDLTRRLDQGFLPILHARLVDANVRYDATFLAVLERRRLSAAAVDGTPCALAHGYGHVARLSDLQRQEWTALHDQYATGKTEQTVLLCRQTATNTGAASAYAWFSTAHPLKTDAHYDGQTGMTSLADDEVCVISRLDGRPLPQPEIAVLLQPGQKAVLEFAIPHHPLAPQRARHLAKWNFDRRLDECRAFWRSKLAAAATVNLPETHLHQRLRAGLLHLDIATYGSEPSGALSASVGWYSAIGSESAPIIQFFDSMGLHDLAARCIQFFLDRQGSDGFIQSFQSYMVENGPVLWSAGEHFRYTRDRAWARRVMPQLLKSCGFLMDWRNRSQRDDPGGYGLIAGKVADPEDPFRQFMLNGLACLGVQRTAEIAGQLGVPEAKVLAKCASVWKNDIRRALAAAMARSPVVPLGNGQWAPTAPPWVETPGPCQLCLDQRPVFSHGTFTARDGLLGPLHLVLSEVLDAGERAADFLLQTNQVLATVRNAAFSQPYYVRNDLVHLRLGQVKAFLKTYYNQLAAMADRHTYTFWEHLFGISPHKTHEEAWFLMQTRWMLYLEDGRTLRLLPGIPRAWMAEKDGVALDGVASYFGRLSLQARWLAAQDYIEARLKLDARRLPDRILLRLPHHAGRRAVACSTGRYDSASETVELTGQAREIFVRLEFRAP